MDPRRSLLVLALGLLLFLGFPWSGVAFSDEQSTDMDDEDNERPKEPSSESMFSITGAESSSPSPDAQHLEDNLDRDQLQSSPAATPPKSPDPESIPDSVPGVTSEDESAVNISSTQSNPDPPEPNLGIAPPNSEILDESPLIKDGGSTTSPVLSSEIPPFHDSFVFTPAYYGTTTSTEPSALAGDEATSSERPNRDTGSGGEAVNTQFLADRTPSTVNAESSERVPLHDTTPMPLRPLGFTQGAKFTDSYISSHNAFEVSPQPHFGSSAVLPTSLNLGPPTAAPVSPKYEEPLKADSRNMTLFSTPPFPSGNRTDTNHLYPTVLPNITTSPSVVTSPSNSSIHSYRITTTMEELVEIFGWRKPGQRKIRASHCGCPKKSKRKTARTPSNVTFFSTPVFATVSAVYKANVFDELTVAPGDIITEVVPHGGKWMKGCIRGFRGVFPSNFAKIARSCDPLVSMVDFEDEDDEVLGPCDPPVMPITMPPGEPIPTARPVIVYSQGMKLQMEAVVEFDYSAQEVDELTIRKGDVITDIRMQPGGWWEGCLYGRRGMFPDNFVKVRDKVDTVSKDTMANNDVQLRPSSGRKCKVLFSYQPANDDELELQLNDIIEILDEVEEGWWRGKLRNRVGVFPSNFVSEITDKQTNGTPGSRKTSATQPPSLSLLRKEENHTSDTGGVIIGETDSPASPTGPDSGNPNALDVDIDAPTLPPKPVKELCRVLFPYDAANEDELTLKEGDIITIVTRDVQDKGWWKGELRGRIGVFPDNFVAIIPQDEHPQARRPDRPPTKVSQPVNSNRARENIVKPTSTSAGSVSSTKRSTENNTKTEEKAPPVLSKKPALPPTAKKPQLRSGMPVSSSQTTPPPPTQAAVVTALKRLSNERTDSPEQRLSDLVDGTASSRMTPPAVVSGDMDFDGVERGAMLTHPTASRAKAPRRRLPTAMLNKEAEQIGGLMNGNADHHESLVDNNHSTSETEKENGTGPGTPGSVSSASSGSASNRNSKDWDKHKAPWMEELKMSQAAKKNHGAKTPPAPSPSKPEPGRVKTDVTDSPASPTSPEPPKSNAITYRQHPTINNVANNNVGSPLSTVLPSSRPQSVHGEVPSRFSTSPSSGSRPLSMYEKPSPVASPAPGTGTGGNAAVSLKQFLELADKVSNLERHCELLTRTVTELSLQVKEEKEKRYQVQQELEKLTDLVTQV